MKVLLIGGGGREHALAWKMTQSAELDTLYIASGNGGTQDLGINVDLDVSDLDGLVDFVKKNEIEMVVCGPEQPLVDGLADHLQSFGIDVVGPTKAGAELEGSKSFAKEFMKEFNIPTADYGTFTADQLEEANSFIDNMQVPVVLKADGLAAGKGVLICQTKEEAKEELKLMVGGKFGSAGATVVIESFLAGIEFSVFALTDGTDYVLLPMAKDYKRIGDGDTGLNTGGMGTVSPPLFVDDALRQKVEESIVRPTIEGISKRGMDYKGFVFFGLIRIGDDPYVIEYNVRMGDPETQVVLPRMKTDLLTCFKALFMGSLGEITIEEDPRVCLSVVLASGGYPGNYNKGMSIALPENLSDHEIIFHAGTRIADGDLQSSGGRVIACTALADSLTMAREAAYNIVKHVSFEGQYCRTDIGLDLLEYD
jgi:phosphoribosylamine--glycine ligase